MSTPELPRPYYKGLTFMAIAGLIGQLSTCDRKNVGAVLIRDGRCISWGFNGAPPGLPHCSENFHGWDNSWEVASAPEADREEMIQQTRQALEEHGCKNVTHAEANAVAFAARQGISTEGATLYVTVSPCAVCARLLIAAGIVKVVYEERYRDPEGVELLKKVGVVVID